MNACTIIAKNYVAQARVLARSFLAHHPGGRFWTLIIDDFDGYIDPAEEPFETLTPEQIGCEPFEDMAFRYHVLELSTAVKPWLLRHLMEELEGPITYLDPDIQVFGSLERLDLLAREHKVVLTPHCTQPIPDDGRRPTQIDIMIAGVYNLGYLTLAPDEDIRELLAWWEDRLRRDCRVDPVYGYFVDQRWFDLAPGLLSDRAIVREPEYNVAYWNLHSRTLAREAGGYTVEGRPLAFFHFSGFDPQEPEVLSRHQNRVHAGDNPALAQILGDYATLVKNEGFAAAQSYPYTYDALPDGTRLDPVVRALFVEAEASGELSAPPFSAEGSAQLLDWLAVQSPGAPAGVHRLLARLYGVRSDLREAFPDLGGPDLDRLFQWARGDGAREVPALALLPLPEPQPEHAREHRPSPRPALWGVNVVGHFRSELGIGEAARQVISALDAVSVPVLAVRGTTQPLSRQGHEFRVAEHADAEFPINLICVNADMLADFAGKAGAGFFADRYSVGLWFWEVSIFPDDWHAAFGLIDEVWAPSAHVAGALAPVSPIPVVPVRIPVQMPAIVPKSRSDLGLPDGFTFLFSFDYLSVFERKNPLAVIRAFIRAFPAQADGPSLLLKCINADRDPASHARLLAAAGEHDRIHVLDSYLDPADKDALMASCDCYVSLHRSEGLGLTMAEAMFLGKPVIATGYSGNLDFMTAENSLLVDHALIPIGPGLPPYPPNGEWAEPDIEHAAALMALVVEDRSAAAELGARAATDIRRTHSPQAAGELMDRRLEHLRERVSPDTADPEHRGERRRIAGALGGRVQRGPAAAGPAGPSRALNSIARRGALRLMRPFTAFQETVNGEVVRSLEAIDEELARQGDRRTHDDAVLGARLRSLEQLSRLPAIVDVRGRSVDELKDVTSALGQRVDELEQRTTEDLWQTDRAVYGALALLSERYRAISSPPADVTGRDPLSRAELRVFSQNGEDGVLGEIFARIGVRERYFVEFGAETGAEANSVFLADVLGWRGLFMECDDDAYAMLERKYRANDGVRTVKAAVSPANLEDLLAAAEVPREPDLLSIDVDGSDYWIWESLESYRPSVLVIEYNSALDPQRKLVQPADAQAQWNGSDYYGASLGALRALGEGKGYRLVHTELCGVNAFFVRADLAQDRFPSPQEVAVRGRPNYFHRGYHHPPHPGQRTYLDLDSGDLLDVGPAGHQVR